MDWIHSLLKLIVTRLSADVISFILSYCVIAAHAHIIYGCHKLGHAQNV